MIWFSKLCYILCLFLQVNESNYGREHIIPSIVQLAFGLLEEVEEGSNKELGKSDCLLGIEGLGCHMLTSLFEVHDMARKEVRSSHKIFLFTFFFFRFFFLFLFLQTPLQSGTSIKFNTIISMSCMRFQLGILKWKFWCKSIIYYFPPSSVFARAIVCKYFWWEICTSFII